MLYLLFKKYIYKHDLAKLTVESSLQWWLPLICRCTSGQSTRMKKLNLVTETLTEFDTLVESETPQKLCTSNSIS